MFKHCNSSQHISTDHEGRRAGRSALRCRHQAARLCVQSTCPFRRGHARVWVSLKWKVPRKSLPARKSGYLPGARRQQAGGGHIALPPHLTRCRVLLLPQHVITSSRSPVHIVCPHAVVGHFLWQEPERLHLVAGRRGALKPRHAEDCSLGCRGGHCWSASWRSGGVGFDHAWGHVASQRGPCAKAARRWCAGCWRPVQGHARSAAQPPTARPPCTSQGSGLSSNTKCRTPACSMAVALMCASSNSCRVGDAGPGSSAALSCTRRGRAALRGTQRPTDPHSSARSITMPANDPPAPHSRKQGALASRRADASIVSPGSTLPPKPLK